MAVGFRHVAFSRMIISSQRRQYISSRVLSNLQSSDSFQATLSLTLLAPHSHRHTSSQGLQTVATFMPTHSQRFYHTFTSDNTQKNWSKNERKTLNLIYNYGLVMRFSGRPPVDPEYEKLTKSLKEDPEVKGWMTEIKGDFEGSGSDSSSTSSSDSSSSSDSESESESPVEVGDNEDISSPAEDQAENNDLRQFRELEIEDEEEYEYEDFYSDVVEEEEELPDTQLPISLERGTTGVYDLEDLVTLLLDENAKDVCVIQIPKDHKYVDYMVIVTGKSTRHLKAMSAIVRWVYKQRRKRRDPRTVHIEGQDTNDWMAVDLGNIALHLFLPEARMNYDLETLWTVGTDYDEKSQKEEDDPFTLYVDHMDTLYSHQLTTDHVKHHGAPQHKDEALNLDSRTDWHGSTNNL